MKTNYFPSLQSTHRESVDAFVAAAHSVRSDRWNTPMAEGKWSPGQVSEHVRLSYTVLANELSGGQGIRPRLPAWQRFFIRLKYLRGILKTGNVPAARAPSELRPSSEVPDQNEQLSFLVREVERFENILSERWNDPKAGVSHHYFGHFSVDQAMQFVTIHTAHHRKQLEKYLAENPV